MEIKTTGMNMLTDNMYQPNWYQDLFISLSWAKQHFGWKSQKSRQLSQTQQFQNTE
jgi:hypothetical protein